MARKRLTSLPDGLWYKLAEFERFVRGLEITRGWGWTLAVTAFLIGFAVLLDSFVDLPSRVRLGLLVVVCVSGLGTAYVKIWRAWWKRYDSVDLAKLIERANPQLNESLVSCIELYDSSIPESERGSALMREMAARQTMHVVAPLEFESSVPSRPARRMALAGLLAWSLLVIPLAIPSSYRLALGRIVAPWLNLDRVTSFWFDVDQGDRLVVRGSDVAISAKPRGDAQRPDSVTLTWIADSGERDSRRVDWDVESATYSTTIPHVMQGFEYSLEGAGNRSRSYRIRVVDAPAIVGLKIEVQPPAYTGQPARILDGTSGDMTVLEQSELRWQLIFNKPLKKVEWKWVQSEASTTDVAKVVTDATERTVPEGKDLSTTRGQDPEIPQKDLAFVLAPDRQSATLRMIADQGGEFRLAIVDENGLTNSSDPDRALIVQPDTAPTLSIIDQPTQVAARPTDVLPIMVEANDDIAVAGLELHYEIDASRKGHLSCAAQQLGKPSIRHQFKWDLTELNLKSGEIVTYRARAVDERPIPGPNETWSERRLVHIDTAAMPPGTPQLAAEQNQLKAFLQELKKDLSAHRHTTREVAEQARNEADKSPDAGVEQPSALQENIEKARDQQDLLNGRVQQLAVAFAQHPLFANLEQQTEELVEQELTSAQHSLDQAEKNQLADRAQDLKHAEEQLLAAEQKLDKLEAQFDSLAKLEQDLLELNRLASNAERLARRLQELDRQKNQPLKKEETAQDKELRGQIAKAKENDIRQKQQELAKQADDLLARQPDLTRAAMEKQQADLAQLAKQAQELAEPQREATAELSRQARAATEMTEELAKRSQELQKGLGELGKSGSPEIRQKVEAADANALEKALKEGNLADAAREQQRIADLLEELQQDLQKQNGGESSRSQSRTPQEIADVASELADQQARQADKARQHADTGDMPSKDELSQAKEQLQRTQQGLESLNSKPVPKEPAAPQTESADNTKRAHQRAQEELQKAGKTQELLAQKIPQPNAGDASTEEQENVERLIKENADQQQSAAEALELLAKKLAEEAKQSQSSELAANDPPQKAPPSQINRKEPDGMPTEATTPPSQADNASRTNQPDSSMPPGAEPGAPSVPSPAPASAAEGAPNNPPMADRVSQKAQELTAQAKQLRKELERIRQEVAANAQGEGEKQEQTSRKLEKLQEQMEQIEQPASPQSQTSDPSQPSGEPNPSGNSEFKRGGQTNPRDAREKDSAPLAGSDKDSQSPKADGASRTPLVGSPNSAKSQPGGQETTSEPSARSDSSSGKSQAVQQADQAQQAMQEVLKERKEGNLGKAAQAGEQAAKALDEITSEPPSNDSGQTGENGSDVPPEAAQQVTEAIRQLQEALRSPPPVQPEATSASETPRSAGAPRETDPPESQPATSTGQPSATSPRRSAKTPENSAEGNESTPLRSASPPSQKMEQGNVAEESSRPSAKQPGPTGSPAEAGQAGNGAEPQETAPAIQGLKQAVTTPSGGEPAEAQTSASRKPSGATPSKPAEDGQSASGSQQGGQVPGQTSSDRPMPGSSTGGVSQGSSQEASAQANQTGNSDRSNVPQSTEKGGSEPAKATSARSDDPGLEGGRPNSPGSAKLGESEKSSQPAVGATGNEQSQESPLESIARRLQQAANALKQAGEQVQGTDSGTAPMRSGLSQGNESSEPQNGSSRGHSPSGQEATENPIQEQAAAENLDVKLERLKRRLAGRKWGELPGKLQTEILQAAQKKPNSEYGEQIRQYFKDIAKTQPVPSTPSKK